jgi:NAD(P)H-flavin reductase
MVPRRHRVARVWREMPDTYTLALEPLDGPGPAFAPGQFNMLYVFGVGEVPISISGDPLQPACLIHTVRAVGAVTRALCALERGAVVGVRGPFGTAWPLVEAEGCDVVLVTGGIGLAPLRPALYHLLARRGQYGRVVLLYGARTPRDMLYRRELERWRGRFDLAVTVTVDHAVGDWYGPVGVVTKLIPGAGFDPAETVALVCGPEVMMRFTLRELQQGGVPPERLYVSLERNMECAIGLCGHRQVGPSFVCQEGPVFRYPEIEPFFSLREV